MEDDDEIELRANCCGPSRELEQNWRVAAQLADWRRTNRDSMQPDERWSSLCSSLITVARVILSSRRSRRRRRRRRSLARVSRVLSSLVGAPRPTLAEATN